MEKLNDKLMDAAKLKSLPGGKWEYLIDDDEKVVFAAETKEEAERMAEAFLKGEGPVMRRVPRTDGAKPKSALVDQDD